MSLHPIVTPLSPATPLFHPDCAKVVTVSSPSDAVVPKPVGEATQEPVTVSVPRVDVITFPAALTCATPVPIAVPTAEAPATPESVILQSPVSVNEPRDDVRPLPVASTGAKVFHAPEFQVCRPHP